MSTDTVPETAASPEVDCVRDTMSLSNILTPSSAGAPDVTVDAPVLGPPSTPTKAVETSPKQETDSPASVMSDTDSSADDDLDGGEDVPYSEREFICVNDEHTPCRTGQYTKDLSRKVISDHFGRNKACTRHITNWPLFCRKHYQRATYSKQSWQIRKISLIHAQFDVIEREFPGTTYDVVFKKSEENRISSYVRKITAGLSKEQAEKDFAPTPGKHFEAPMRILLELDMDTGENKSLAQVKNIAERIHAQIQAEDTLQVPAIEFLPKISGMEPSPKKTTKAPKTPSPKKSRAPKSPGSKTTPGRVSAKGSVKKPQK